MICMDLHIHSKWSDGNSTIDEIVKVAESRNLEAIAVTDHVRQDSGWLDLFVEEVRRAQKNTDIKVLAGIEASILDFQGNINAHPSFFPKVDLVLAAAHSIPSSTGAPLNKSDILKMKSRIPWLYGKLISGVMNNPHVDIIAHLGKWLRENNLLYIPKIMQEKIAVEARNNGKIVEINTKTLPPKSLIHYLEKYQVKTSIGSDAHNKKDIGFRIKEVIQLLPKNLNWLVINEV